MDIPVFVSCPTTLNPAQVASRKLIDRQLRRYKLTPRALGMSDYPKDFPLREVLVIAKHCSGGIILGFEQFLASEGVHKRGTSKERQQREPAPMPTPWNNLEAGILYGMRRPLLIFREPDIQGGVFDPGVTDVFVHSMPKPTDDKSQRQSLNEVFLKWQAVVREHYYRA